MVRTFAGLFVLGASVSFGAEPRFTIIPHLPGAQSAVATSLSSDGSIVGGTVSLSNGRTSAFRYSVLTGILDVVSMDPTRPGVGTLYAMSSSGDFWAGTGPYPGGAARGHVSGTTSAIGVLPGYLRSVPYSVSGDGSVVVGQSISSDGFSTEPFRWSPQTGLLSLGSLYGIRYGNAHDVSRDGTTIVGESAAPGLYGRAFRWTAAGGLTQLPAISNDPQHAATAYSVSADGRTIWGNNTVGHFQSRAVRWVDGVLNVLPDLDGFTHPVPRDTDDSGTIAVGFGNSAAARELRGIVWSNGGVPQSAEDYLRGHSVVLPAGVGIYRVWSVSGDGLTISGDLSDGRPFVASVPGVGSASLFGAFCGTVAVQRRRRAAGAKSVMYRFT